ncbi:MAG: AmpG family muropeptide MFS transporter [Alphaproteobacteria bacterium]
MAAPAAAPAISTRSRWRAALAIYGAPGVPVMLFLGFAAGLPLPLTGFTLRQWLSESEATLAVIGLTASVGIAYSFKFLWSPLLDRLRPPPGFARLGRRRGWLLAIQLLLALAIAGLGLSDPRAAVQTTIALAVIVAYLSASQDIVIDAYRIERLAPEAQGAGLAAYIWGYRVALLAGNAGVLLLVGDIGWTGGYLAMAALMAVGIVCCLVMREPSAPAEPPLAGEGAFAKTAAFLRRAVVAPLADFAKRDGWLWILLFVCLFKLGEALAGTMTAPFYRSLGYSRETVAGVSGVFGLVATLVGVAVGGLLVARLGTARALIGTGILQMVSNLMYVALAYGGGDVGMLWLQVGVENFTDGLADAAFVAYLSSLTRIAFTATQYALLSSLATVPLRTVGASSGWLADGMGWPLFFLMTTAAALPALAVMFYLLKRFPPGRGRLPASPPAGPPLD